jgi:hypothetical protein
VLLATFILLQFVDFATTLVGLRIGASEASPLVRFLLTAGVGPVLSVGSSKLVAFGLAGACLVLQRRHVIRWINYWYGALAAWNVLIIVKLATA